MSFAESEQYNITVLVSTNSINSNNVQIYNIGYIDDYGEMDPGQLNEFIELYFDKEKLEKNVPENPHDLAQTELDVTVTLEQLNFENKTRLNVISWDISPLMFENYAGEVIADTVIVKETIEREEHYLKSVGIFRNNNANINVIDYRDYQVQNIPETNYIGKTLKIIGEYINSEQNEIKDLMIIPLETEIVKEEETINKDEDVYEIVLKLNENIFKSTNNIVYNLNSIEEYGNIDPTTLENKKNVYFKSNILNDKMPKNEDIKYNSLVKNSIKAKVKLEHLPESGLTRIIIQDWDFFNNTDWAGTIIVEDIIYRDEYYLKAKVNSDEIKYIIIDNRLSSDRNIPASSYVGKHLKIIGERLEETDIGLLYVKDYIVLLKEEFKTKKEEKKNTVKLYGKLIKSLYREDYEKAIENLNEEETDNLTENLKTERIINQIYEFHDSIGNKYYAYFNNQDLIVPAANEEGRPIELEGTIKDENLEYASIQVKNYSLLETEKIPLKKDTFSQINCVLNTVKESNDSYTVYKGTMDNEQDIEIIVNESTELISLNNIPLNEKLIVTIYTNEIKNNIIIVTALDIKKESEVNENLILELLKNKNGELVYQINTYNNEIKEVSFKENILKGNYPKNNLTGKKIIYTLIPNTNNVIAWKIINEADYKFDTGFITELIEENDYGITYRFLSEHNQNYKIFLPRDGAMIDTDLITDPKDLLKNTFNISGIMNHNKYGRIMILDSIKYTDKPFRNLNDNKLITIRGKVKRIKSNTNNGIIYYVENEYNKSYLINISDNMGDQYPLYDITNEDIIVNGYLLDNGIILVKDLKFINRDFNKLPIEKEKTYSNIDKYPNMQYFCGKLELFTIDKTYYTLKTTSERYSLTNIKNNKDIMNNNLTKYVEIHGQVYTHNYPSIEKYIDIYSVKGVSNCLTEKIYAAKDYEEDKYKNSIYTEQSNRLENSINIGIGLFESMYLDFPVNGK